MLVSTTVDIHFFTYTFLLNTFVEYPPVCNSIPVFALNEYQSMHNL